MAKHKKKGQPKGKPKKKDQRDWLLPAKIALATELLKLLDAVIDFIKDQIK